MCVCVRESECVSEDVRPRSRVCNVRERHGIQDGSLCHLIINL